MFYSLIIIEQSYDPIKANNKVTNCILPVEIKTGNNLKTVKKDQLFFLL